MVNPYKTHWYHRQLAHWLHKSPGRDAGTTRQPEYIRLVPADGTTPSALPPVRIFLGTEPRQYRATRVFVWSVMRTRDPSRAYEIHLMSNLAGIPRDGWKTGFTNYRYMIPDLAGRSGRAIYNDVDQIYLTDPAKLFDMEMGGKGVLAISQADNSVMLIDCAVMAGLWTRNDVAAGRKHAHFKDTMTARGLLGELPESWNARDGALPLEQSDCLHYTTLHTQPWKPFPEQLRYAPHPLAGIWRNLEREADEAGFLLFTSRTPSAEYGELVDLYRRMHEGDAKLHNPDDADPFTGRRLAKHAGGIATLIAETGSNSVLDYGAGKGEGYMQLPGEPAGSAWRRHPAWGEAKVRLYDPGHAPIAHLGDETCDGVISTDVVEHLAPFDAPWVIDQMFSRARKFVYIVAASYPADAVLPDGRNAHTIQQPPHWWQMQMELAARRYPHLRWQLVCETKGPFGKRRTVIDATTPSALD